MKKKIKESYTKLIHILLEPHVKIFKEALHEELVNLKNHNEYHEEKTVEFILKTLEKRNK